MIDEIHLRYPFMGSRRIRNELIKKGHNVNRKRIVRIMRDIGIGAIYPKPKTTIANKALINRGSLTFWIDEEAITEWKQDKQGKRGRPRRFSDLAITVALMVKRVFSMPFRALQGFLDSVYKLAHIPLVCPQYT